jgi:hypothetical protein
MTTRRANQRAVRQIDKPLKGPRAASGVSKSQTAAARPTAKAAYFCKCLVSDCGCNRAVEGPWRVCDDCRAGQHSQAT